MKSYLSISSLSIFLIIFVNLGEVHSIHSISQTSTELESSFNNRGLDEEDTDRQNEKDKPKHKPSGGGGSNGGSSDDDSGGNNGDGDTTSNSSGDTTSNSSGNSDSSKKSPSSSQKHSKGRTMAGGLVLGSVIISVATLVFKRRRKIAVIEKHPLHGILEKRMVRFDHLAGKAPDQIRPQIEFDDSYDAMTDGAMV